MIHVCDLVCRQSHGYMRRCKLTRASKPRNLYILVMNVAFIPHVILAQLLNRCISRFTSCRQFSFVIQFAAPCVTFFRFSCFFFTFCRFFVMASYSELELHPIWTVPCLVVFATAPGGFSGSSFDLVLWRFSHGVTGSCVRISAKGF